MKKILIVLIFTLAFSSCSDKTEETKVLDSGIKKDSEIIEVQKSEFEKVYGNLKDKYRYNSEFNTCMIGSVKSCFSDIVLKDVTTKLDIKICDDFLDEQSKQSCKDKINSIIALKDKSFDSCNNLSNSAKISCKKSIARELVLENRDISFCKKIEPESGNLSGDLNNPVTRCINDMSYELAVKYLDTKYCEKMTTSSQIKECEDEVVMLIEDK